MQFFTRKYRNMRVVVEPRSTVVIEGVPIIKGLNNKFPLGLAVEFKDGLYKTNDPAIIKALKAHVNYGVHFFAEDIKPGEQNEEGAQMEQDKREGVEGATSKCQFCGEKFANKGLLGIHIKTCPRKDET